MKQYTVEVNVLNEEPPEEYIEITDSIIERIIDELLGRRIITNE